MWRSLAVVPITGLSWLPSMLACSSYWTFRHLPPTHLFVMSWTDHLPGHLGRVLDLVEKSGIPLSLTQKQYPSWHWTLLKWPSASQDGTYWPRRRGFFWVAASIRVHKVSTNWEIKINKNHYDLYSNVINQKDLQTNHPEAFSNRRRSLPTGTKIPLTSRRKYWIKNVSACTSQVTTPAPWLSSFSRFS